ncbi:MAG: transcription initiation factor IIB family protein [archaeon]|nr:transcription initiation factor IIB family protein [archaeon]
MITQRDDYCSYCNAKNSIVTDFSFGEVVCSACGTVLEDRIIDETYEKRNFGGDNQNGGKDQNRIGGPISPFSDNFSSGIVISAGKNSSVSHLKQRTISSGPSNQMKMMNTIEELGEKLGVKAKTVDICKNLAIAVEEKKKLKGKNLRYMIASVYYVALRVDKVPKTIAEISNVLNLEKKKLTKCINLAKSVLNTSYENISIKDNIVRLVHSNCNNLFLDVKVDNCAQHIAELICSKEILAGKSPSTICACVIYFACLIFGVEKDKKQIADHMNISETTVTSAINILKQYKKDILPEAYKDKIEIIEKA